MAGWQTLVVQEHVMCTNTLPAIAHSCFINKIYDAKYGSFIFICLLYAFKAINTPYSPINHVSTIFQDDHHRCISLEGCASDHYFIIMEFHPPTFTYTTTCMGLV